MTVSQARKILQSSAKDLSDEEVEDQIKVATYFKDIFFKSETSKEEQLNAVERPVS